VLNPKWAAAVAMLVTCMASGQSVYQLTFKGTTSMLDSSGEEKVTPLTDKMLVAEWAGKAGVSNLSNLVLAFHRNADSLGDAIEVVNRKTGDRVTTVFPLAFPETASASSPKGSTERRFAYMFNLYQSELTRGSAIYNQQMVVNKKGQTNRFVVSGEMQWHQLPEGPDGLKIRRGTFKASKRIR
jgi:hypothetical protein